MKSTRYLQALETQIDLKRFYESADGKAIYFASRTGDTTPGGRDLADARSVHYDALLCLLDVGTPTYVDPRITQALSDAMPTLPDKIPLHADDVPMPSGFAYLDGAPWRLPPTVAGFEQSITAIGWLTLKDGLIWVSAFGTVREPGHPSAVDHLSQVLFSEAWRVGDPIDHDGDLARELAHVGEDTSVHVKFIDHTQTARVIDVPAADVYASEYMRRIEGRRFAYALWHFMGQRIVSLERGHLDRATRRRMPPERQDSVVQIVELRARQVTPREPGMEEASRQYSVRWVVRGHWRSQWYPSLDRHKPLWISAYDKGPEGAPLRSATKLFAVAR
jgi:hypothetical protein